MRHNTYVQKWQDLNRKRKETSSVTIDDMRLQVHRPVFSPSPKETWSSQSILDQLPDDLTGYRILDVGTGTGVLALACARRGALEVVGVDSAAHAINNAKANAESLKLNNVRFVKGNLFEFHKAGNYRVVGNQFNLILANLPILEGPAIQKELVKASLPFLDHAGTLIFTYAEFGPEEQALEEFLHAQRDQFIHNEFPVTKHGVRWSVHVLTRHHAG